MKDERKNGITLIALIVTIIILLILAGIAISQLTNSGLFTNVQTAKQEHENAQEDEEDKLSKYENYINSYIDGNREYVPISYTTGEQDTGLKWVDGKTIYQKTIIRTNVETGDTEIDVSNLNIDQCIDVDGCHDGLTQNDMNDYIDYRYANFCWYNKSTNLLYIRNSNANFNTAYVTIKYTKKANPIAE